MATADLSRLPVSSGTTLQTNLQRLAARRNRRQKWLALAAALTWALGLDTLLLLAYRFHLIDGRAWMLLVPLGLALIVGFIVGNRRSRGAFEAALEADQSLGWQDRLTSALAFSKSESVPLGASTELVPALIEDAAARSNGLDAKQLYPLRFDAPFRRLALVSAMFVATLLMNDIPWLLSPAQKATAKTLKAEGKKLEAVSKEIREEKKEVEKAAEVKRLNKKMAELSREMQRGRMTKREALTQMGELKKKLEQAGKSSDQNSAKKFDQAMKALRDDPKQTPEGKQFQKEMERGDKEAAAKQMDKLAERLEKGGMKKEEQKQAANDLQKAADALKKAGGEQNEEAAKQLEQAAKELKQQSQQQSQQGGQQNQSDGQKQQGQNGSQQQNQAGAAAGKALREMAKGMREGGSQSGDSQSLKEMLKKIEEAEAQTGSNSSGQSGEGKGKDGKGKGKSGQGEGEGEGLSAGKDLMPSNPNGKVNGGAGLGPRNNSQGNKGGGPSSQKIKRNGDKRRWEDVWSDRLPATKKGVDRVKGKYGKDGEAESLQTQTQAKGGSVKTPYYEVYESYKKDAEDAINKEAVPPSYKEPVKEYFDSLKPEK